MTYKMGLWGMVKGSSLSVYAAEGLCWKGTELGFLLIGKKFRQSLLMVRVVWCVCVCVSLTSLLILALAIYPLKFHFWGSAL